MIPKIIILHHTVSLRDKTTIQNVNNWHSVRFPKSSLGWNIGYHYLITGDGKIIQTRRDNEIGMHTIPNDGKIGICLTGNFEIEQPSPVQLTSLQQLLEDLKIKYGFNDEQIKAHSELNQTLCPGIYLREWLDKYRQLGFLKKKIERIKELIRRLFKNR